MVLEGAKIACVCEPLHLKLQALEVRMILEPAMSVYH